VSSPIQGSPQAGILQFTKGSVPFALACGVHLHGTLRAIGDTDCLAMKFNDLNDRERTMNAWLRMTLALLPLSLPITSMATTPVSRAETTSGEVRSPLVDKVRAATERFRDINVAIAEGWVQGTPCVSGPNSGAMGVHYVLPARIAAAVLSADQPESLIYEPLAGGKVRLVGVEFIILANVWATQHPNSGPPALDGQLLNYVAAPNRYGLPAFYEIHVWAWEQNPVGTFADWNTRVTCDQQPLN
jgi:hypothetical protein